MTIKSTFPDLIQLTSFGMGSGNEEHNIKLLDAYLTQLLESGQFPKTITFCTEAVKLITTGSPLLEQFKALEDKGVLLIPSAVCLNHYGLWDQVEVGVVGRMCDIIEKQTKASKIVSL